MPCFMGVAVSIHAPSGPLPEHSIQKQARNARITSYIAVPPPKVPANSVTGIAEQSVFAVSITLLVPNQVMPYSTPVATAENPYPQPRMVGPMPGEFRRANEPNHIIPYVPRTSSENETLAAYIYFDGRPKEEVATLLRRGEETWVNSRWVSVPQSEGGGLAERDFLFREVGLERWLDGLDLKTEDKASKIEKRLQKLKRLQKGTEQDSTDDMMTSPDGAANQNGDAMISDDSDSDDEPPQTEAAGQIKVALFRVVASGEVKKGEYEAQFEAHEDEEGAGPSAPSKDADLEHTTSLADPKTLDPKTISTQTVTGLDGPDHPFAIFTFLYRGEKQLQKMGIIEPPRNQPTKVTPKSKGTDFSKLGPLSKFGTVGFSGYREDPTRKAANAKDDEDEGMDSDDEKRATTKDDDKFDTDKVMSAGDVHRQGELADGVRQIKLKRAHSTEVPSPTVRKSPRMHQTAASAKVQPTVDETISSAKEQTIKQELLAPLSQDLTDALSPFKKPRAETDQSQSGAIKAEIKKEDI